MPGACFLSRNKEATEVCSLGLTKTVLASPLSEPAIPLDHFLPSVTLVTVVPREARGQMGRPLTHPRWCRGQRHHRSHTTGLLCSCDDWWPCGRFSSLGWGSGQWFSSQGQGGGNFSSSGCYAGSSLHSAATATGRAQGWASRASHSPFTWLYLQSRWTLVTPGHLRPQPPPLQSSNDGALWASPCTCPEGRRGKDRWPWAMAHYLLGLPPAPRRQNSLMMSLMMDRKVGMVTLWPAALLSVLPVDNPRGESGALWRGSKMRPPFVPHPKPSQVAIKILEESCLPVSWKRAAEVA